MILTAVHGCRDSEKRASDFSKPPVPVLSPICWMPGFLSRLTRSSSAFPMSGRLGCCFRGPVSSVQEFNVVI